MITGTGYVPVYDMPGFATYDASAGVAKGSWSAQIFGQNLTNVNASLFTTGGQLILTETPIRPRVLGIKVSYKFAEK